MRIGIIGGGIAGLSAAYDLSREGHQVTVFERDATLGGQAGTFPMHDEPLERFYHHIFTNDRDVVSLIDELGLSDQMEWLESRMGFFAGGKAYPFGTLMATLRFTPLSFFDRIRLGLLVLYLQRFKDWKKMEKITAADWVRKNGGQAIYDVVWGPLLRGKFGDSAERVSMTWLWGKIHLRGGSRSSGAMKERLGYMRGSYQKLIDALERAIVAQGGQVHTNSAVREVMVDRGRAIGLEVETVRGEPGSVPATVTEVPFDTIISTVPSPVFLNLVRALPDDYAAKLRSIDYQSAVVVVLEMNHKMTDIYWMNISDRTIPFVGAIEHTNFISRERYANAHVLYLSNYLAKTNELYQLSDDELVKRYMQFLPKLNPDFRPSWVERYHVFRDDAGQPIVTTEYSQRIPEHETPIKGLYLANTTQIYPEDRGMNYSVRLGRNIAKMVDSAQ